jgi:hypothetical protein
MNVFGGDAHLASVSSERDGSSFFGLVAMGSLASADVDAGADVTGAGFYTISIC